MLENFRYTAVIRTLGTAGEKYQKLLESLQKQTCPPQEIIVYIADGYKIPKETIGTERYVYVKKGMVAQRALQYKEVNTEYILCLDDDLYLPTDTVETFFKELQKNHVDVIAPDIFPNHKRKTISRLMMTIAGRMRARKDDGIWGYKVMSTGGYSYNGSPTKSTYLSQTNAGACFLCKKENFLKIHFEDELWLDEMSYPLGEDQVMYYKMYKKGLKQITLYKHNILHLDGGNNMSPEKEQKRIYSDLFFKVVFWHRFLYSPEQVIFMRWWKVCCILYFFIFTLFISLLKCDFKMLNVKWHALLRGVHYIQSESYKLIPRVL